MLVRSGRRGGTKCAGGEMCGGVGKKRGRGEGGGGGGGRGGERAKVTAGGEHRGGGEKESEKGGEEME